MHESCSSCPPVVGDVEASVGYCWPVRVYYEDTDAGGVVYHATYLNYMERARTEWLRALGYAQEALVRERGILFAVHRLSVDYLYPARLDDQLCVRVGALKIRRASMEFSQQIQSKCASYPRLLTRATVKIACLAAKNMTPCPIPDPILDAFHTWENRRCEC
ncbi:tol-pal system-associated acyl-CoA thioesterase [Thiorhodospira sibirica]|uniref:tol-pal system-associated acyl-CoA thioesterase n=1 Tax=Thiorhodospira sibirica TaxID=154347 RepID=UPI00022C1D4B|nr:tol-pal system-associated acyl-CoA thioesterase [Thiorhodospira sibirica]